MRVSRLGSIGSARYGLVHCYFPVLVPLIVNGYCIAIVGQECDHVLKF
jgi:hypothetical protein